MAQDHLIESTNYPYLDIQVEIQGEQFQGSALLDTGYTGELIIPEHTLALLGPPIDNRNIFLGRFFSSLYDKPVPGVAFFALSLISRQQRRSYPTMVG